VLEPLFLKHGVSLVLSGHEHFYERLKPKKESRISLWVAPPNSEKEIFVRRISPRKGFDTDNAFMLCEIEGDQLHFQTVSRTGQIVDSGVVTRPQVRAAAAAGGFLR
jgi:hypothetical protein